MTFSEPDREAHKRAAVERAVEWVESGMVVGLGTGSTAVFAIERIGALLAGGALSGILGVPTSTVSADLAIEVGIPATDLDEHPVVDLTIDGADEVDSDLNMIKGGGGALLHEKIVATVSLREVIVVDSTKPSDRLGTHCPLPVEVVRFGWKPEADYLDDLGAEVLIRQRAGQPFVTDEGNWILDAAFEAIDDPERLNGLLSRRPGVVEHGLFLGLATDLVVAGPSGVEHRQ